MTSSALSLRPFVAADDAALIGWVASAEELLRFGGPRLTWPLDVAQLDAIRAEAGAHAYTAIVSRGRDGDGEPVGHAELRGAAPGDALVMRLGRVLIAPTHRGWGLGRALVLAALGEARRLGAAAVELNVYTDNVAARSLYASVGFVDAGRFSGPVRRRRVACSHAWLAGPSLPAVRRTKIVCTIGPASDDSATLRALIAAGMDVARLNFSHGDPDTHARVAERLRDAAGREGRPVAILQDLQGPKLRIGRLDEGTVTLRDGYAVELVCVPGTVGGRHGDVTVLASEDPGLAGELAPGEPILLADGRLELRVDAIEGQTVRATVVRGGELGERQGINLPGTRLRRSALTEKDKGDLVHGARIGVDFVALSFVRKAADLVEARALLRAQSSSAPLVAKIERPEAIENFEEILGSTQSVMIARGDLGVELSPERVPVLQKQLLERSNAARVPVVVATQMLESMVHSARPTRAEAADVANAVFDGADAVMLSGETAAGDFPVDACRTMAAICTEAERSSAAYMRVPAADPTARRVEARAEAICRAAAAIAGELRATAIVAFTETGTTALRVSKHRPDTPVIAASPYPETVRRAGLLWGVSGRRIANVKTTDAMVAEIDRRLLASGEAHEHDLLVIVAGTPVGNSGTTNLLRLHRVGEAD